MMNKSLCTKKLTETCLALDLHSKCHASLSLDKPHYMMNHWLHFSYYVYVHNLNRDHILQQLKCHRPLWLEIMCLTSQLALAAKAISCVSIWIS